MATTTNYGWTTPDDTALVKDGASAIRTLGSSVDTTVKALSPGTTAGDVDYYTSSTAKARLGIGTTGQLLTVVAGVPAWATLSAGGITLLATTTLSGTSTVVSSISQAYKTLFLVGTGINWTGNAIFQINPNSSAGQVTCSGVATATASQFTNIQPISNGNGSANTANGFVMTINNYTSTARKPLDFHGSMGSTSINYGGTSDSGSAITSLAYTSSVGTATFTGGTILLYGVN